MNASTLWWLLAGALVVVELMTGTFYLLMLALGAVAGAVAALLGLSLTAQVASAALVGGLAVAFWSLRRQRQAAGAPDPAQSVHLDVGETVEVQAWSADGTTQVRHRGALWGAVMAEGQTAQCGLHRIEAITGQRLVLKKV